MMQMIVICLVVFAFIYIMMIARFDFALAKGIKNKLTSGHIPKTKVTVIVPFRNEAVNIENIFNSLKKQDYPKDLLEIIFSDDHSVDDSIEKLKKLQNINQEIDFSIVRQSNKNFTGKKAALENGINIANGELILATDADCILQTQWVRSFALIYEIQKPSMITGMVRCENANGFWNGLQGLDVLSLTGTGNGSVAAGWPLMCNGANLAFDKKDFIAAGGYNYGKDIASGDDTFLMLSMKSKRMKIVFNHHRESIVTTKPAMTLNEFLMQRIRWAKKVSGYREGYVKAAGLLVLIANIFLPAFAIFSLVAGQPTQGFVLLTLFVIKSVIDFHFLKTITGFAERQYLLWLFLPSLIIYPFYLVTIGTLVLWRKRYTWKNREYN